MQLTCLYSNRAENFRTIKFNAGLNVILAEIRDPENSGVDTHNLGKSTFGRVIDFCLLKGVTKSFFTERNAKTFEPFVFFLELELAPSSYITLRRAAKSPTKVAFKLHGHPPASFVDLPEEEWDHWAVPIVRAKEMLDGFLNFQGIGDWGFRSPLSYLLRSQEDYNQVFKLTKHQGGDTDWKPALALMMGLDGGSARSAYLVDGKIAKEEAAVTRLRLRAGPDEDLDKLEELVAAKTEEIESIQDKLDQFDFRDVETQINKELVESIESDVAEFNNERYYLSLELQQLKDTVENRVLFKTSAVEDLFREAGAPLGTDLLKSHADLVKFHRAITQERNKYLREELKSREARLIEVADILTELNGRRKAAMEGLREHESLQKLRGLSDRLTRMRIALDTLDRRRKDVRHLLSAERGVQVLRNERVTWSDTLTKNLEKQPKPYLALKKEFRDIVKVVTERAAVLSTRVNNAGNFEFSAEFVSPDGDATSEDLGNTYRKFLCIAFDLAILVTHLKHRFPRFAYHDGIFEALDDRKKLRLVGVMRKVADLGAQQFVTTLDSDLPIDPSTGEKFAFSKSEIVLVLHDIGDRGRLFQMPAW